jgi:hypothetical protein
MSRISGRSMAVPRLLIAMLSFICLCLNCRNGARPPKRSTEWEFIRELSVHTDWTRHCPTVIRAQPGLDIPFEGFWYRYEAFLGIPPAELTPMGSPRPHPFAPGHTLVYWGQVHQGYPVANGGYRVATEGPWFRSAYGSFMFDIRARVPKPIGESAALQAAIRFLKLVDPLPWTHSHSCGPGCVFHPEAPKPYLSLTQNPGGPTEKDLRLTWHINFGGTGLNLDVGALTLDAGTGEVLESVPGSIR